MALKAETTEELQAALSFLQAWNEMRMRKFAAMGSPIPHPYDKALKLKYIEDRRGVERWPTAEQVLERGGANCDGLAAYLAAWLTTHGEKAAAIVRESSFGWHCLVQTPSGLLCPSTVLGMPK